MLECLKTSHLLDCFLAHPTGYELRHAKPAGQEAIGWVVDNEMYLTPRHEIVLVKRSEAAKKKRKSGGEDGGDSSSSKAGAAGAGGTGMDI